MAKSKVCPACKAKRMVKRTGPPLWLTCKCGHEESPTQPQLVSAVDAEFSKFVRRLARDDRGGVSCFTCPFVGPVAKMQAGHWIPRQHMATRWEPWNVNPQCYACNVLYGGRPQEYREHLASTMGEERVAELALRRHQVRSYSRDELQELYLKYHTKAKELE